MYKEKEDSILVEIDSISWMNITETILSSQVPRHEVLFR